MLPDLIYDEHSPLRFFGWLVLLTLWLLSQGALGACAFIGTSAIVKEMPKKDSTNSNVQEIVDVTDRNFLNARVLLGQLFAIILGFPFAAKSVNSLAQLYYQIQDAKIDSTTLAYILLPFMVGFSISLVLTILGRLISAIETFFGGSARP
jgi:hypothetical protein